jgi:uncharacterized membrane protein
MKTNLDENDLDNIRSFSPSLGKLLRQIGEYTVIQIIASVILAFISVGTLFFGIIETSLSALFNIFQSSIWTILIASIILEVISYIFIIRLIKLLMSTRKKGIPFQDNYRNSAIFFIIGIIVGIILLFVGIILTNWILQLIGEILNNPSFEIEDLEQIPSTDIISTLAQAGRIGLSIAGFYYLKQNFRQLSSYMRNDEKVHKGLKFLVIGYSLLILGDFIGIVVALGSFIGLAGLILTIAGYFQASDGLKITIWRIPHEKEHYHPEERIILEKKPQKNYAQICEGLLYKYLEENQQAFTVKALENRLDDIFTNYDEKEYSREHLQEILNKMKVNGRIQFSLRNGEYFYFFPR